MADGEAAPLSDLAELGHRGVGDRTGEGFGRFEVNHPLLTATQMVSASDLPPSPPPAGTLAGVDAAVLQGLEARSMELFITERVELALAGDIQSNWLHLEKKNPGNSQLGGLRAAVRSDDGSLATVKAWWGSMTAVPRRSNRWPDATKKAVHALLGNPSDVWKLLGVSDADLSAIGGPHSAETKQRHTNAAVLALLAGCMRAGQRGNHDHAEAAHDVKESN
jgi:hypothetical protein